LNDSRSGYSLKMNVMSDNAFHLKNPINSIFNVEISLHVCSFYQGFGHLLASYPNRSSQIEVQPGLVIAFPPRNPPIITTFKYPNIVPRNFNSHSNIEGDWGEFPRFSNPTRNPFPSPKSYGSFATQLPYNLNGP